MGHGPGMEGDQERQLREDSDQLMSSLRELKDLEADKRDEEISTPRFHELAERVEQQARKVFDVATMELAHGERTGRPTGHSIDEIPPTDAEAREQEAYDRGPVTG